MRRAARLAMQMLELNRSLAARTHSINLGIKGDQRHCKIARINRNAGFAPAQQSMAAVDAFTGRAAAAGLALVAGERLAAPEVGAARALEQIAAKARHVAQLLRCRPP